MTWCSFIGIQKEHDVYPILHDIIYPSIIYADTVSLYKKDCHEYLAREATNIRIFFCIFYTVYMHIVWLYVISYTPESKFVHRAVYLWQQ